MITLTFIISVLLCIWALVLSFFVSEIMGDASELRVVMKETEWIRESFRQIKIDLVNTNKKLEEMQKTMKATDDVINRICG